MLKEVISGLKRVKYLNQRSEHEPFAPESVSRAVALRCPYGDPAQTMEVRGAAGRNIMSAVLNSLIPPRYTVSLNV